MTGGIKIGVVGGASLRTPLLARGLDRSDLPVAELTLFDVDQARLPLIADLARRLAPGLAVRACDEPVSCVADAAFVFTSIRVGGIEGRARDERACQALGVLGQETVGPAGFAMAMRTIGPMVEYARLVAAHAPDAWIVNFTNPVGIVTQAVRAASPARVVGICDTPLELCERVARVLEVPESDCTFEYFGLNHLGWLREVTHRGRPMLGRLLEDPDRLAGVYRAPLFEPEFLRALGLLPTEYLFYYYATERAVQNLDLADATRGASIQLLNDELMRELQRPETDRTDAYLRYLHARDASYFRIESGTDRAAAGADTGGYDRIAIRVARAMHFNTGDVVPLNVANRGNLAPLEDEDVVEVPCRVDANGVWPLHVGPVPEAVRPLLEQVKTYERLTVDAALGRHGTTPRAALAANPLVADDRLAGRLLAALEIA